MSRPVLETADRSDSDWLTKVNSNFEKLLDGPLPVCDNPTSFNAKLYKDCLGILSGEFYTSNGTSWVQGRLAHIADLNPATVSLSDIVTAYNTLLADMRAKGMLAP